MSGHSKWHSIKHKKAATDAKRGKIFTVHAKMIAMAARNGGDPMMNPSLRTAIDRAKADNVPNANIERAIKKGSGEDKDAAQYEELSYEAMGPGGSSLMIDVITDNRNRSLTNIRTLLMKNGGTLGSSGSASWKYDHLAEFQIPLSGQAEEMELALIEAGAEDLEQHEETFLAYTSIENYGSFRKQALAQGLTIDKDAIVWKPKNLVTLSDDDANKLEKLLEKLDDDEDVSAVYTDAG